MGLSHWRADLARPVRRIRRLAGTLDEREGRRMSDQRIAGKFVMGDGLQQGESADSPNGALPPGWHTITVTARAAPVEAANLYVGDVPWQHIPPPPPWYGQPQVPVMLTTGASTEQQVWPFNNVDELREFVKAVVRETLEEDARAIRERKEFQATKQAGTCCACKGSGEDMIWVNYRLAHRDEECRRIAAEMPPVREHRG